MAKLPRVPAVRTPAWAASRYDGRNGLRSGRLPRQLLSCSHNLYPLLTMLCSSRCRSRLRSVGDLVETGQPMKRPAKKLVESRRFGISISMGLLLIKSAQLL